MKKNQITMSEDLIEINFTYQNQTQTQKVKLKNLIYTKFQKLLGTHPDELVIIIDNDYDKIIPRSQKFFQIKNTNQYYIYNIKDLLKEKILADDKIAKDKKQREEQVQQSIFNNKISFIPKPILEASLAADQKEDIYESIQLEIKYSCYNCHKILEGLSFQLNCLHVYHLECLKGIIMMQIGKNDARLQCICNQQITTKLVQNFIQDKNLIDLYFNNQLKIIQKDKTKYFKKCQKNEQCPFFYIETDNQGVSYCEYCDQQKQTLTIFN